MLNTTWITWAGNAHDQLYAQLSKTREEMKPLSPEELTDIGFICKKMYEQIDDLRKEVQNLQDLAEKLACLKAISEEKVKIQGQLATGTPDVSMSANLPHPQKNPEAYLALCDYLGFPEVAVQNDLFRIHWPGFKEFFTKLMGEGKPVPPGIELDKTHAHYKLKYRGRTNV
jgi:hypothetical protein